MISPLARMAHLGYGMYVTPHISDLSRLSWILYGRGKRHKSFQVGGIRLVYYFLKFSLSEYSILPLFWILLDIKTRV